MGIYKDKDVFMIDELGNRAIKDYDILIPSKEEVIVIQLIGEKCVR